MINRLHLRPAMSIASPHPETRIVLNNVSWETFEALVADDERLSPRFAYDQGILEIMSPSAAHEWFHRLVGRVIEAYTVERRIPIHSAGSTTMKAQLKERGLEPDECYYISRELLIRGRDKLDLTRDPSPDLAVEVEISRSAVNKLAIYGDLGVREVWFYDGDVIRIHVMQADGSYASQLASSELPELTVELVEGFLARRSESDETTWVRSIHEWARKLGE